MGGIKKKKLEIKKLEKILLRLSNQALDKLIIDRKREGAKIQKIMAFTELIFGLQKNDRVVTFTEISQRTSLSIEEVEFMV